MVTQASQGSYDLIPALPAFAAWMPDGPKLARAYASRTGNGRAGKQIVLLASSNHLVVACPERIVKKTNGSEDNNTWMD